MSTTSIMDLFKNLPSPPIQASTSSKSKLKWQGFDTPGYCTPTTVQQPMSSTNDRVDAPKAVNSKSEELSERKLRGGSSCCVPHCRNFGAKTQREGKAISYHNFPTALDQRSAWILALGFTESALNKGLRVCSAHFWPKDFHDREDAKCPRLKSTAVPSIFPGMKIPEAVLRAAREVSSSSPKRARYQHEKSAISWNRTIIFKLIDLFKAEPCIYNPLNEFHRNVTERKRAYTRIAVKLGIPEPIDLKIIASIRKKIRHLRSQFVKQDALIRRAADNNSDTSALRKKKKWCFYEKLLFFRDVVGIWQPPQAGAAEAELYESEQDDELQSSEPFGKDDSATAAVEFEEYESEAGVEAESLFAITTVKEEPADSFDDEAPLPISAARLPAASSGNHANQSHVVSSHGGQTASEAPRALSQAVFSATSARRNRCDNSASHGNESHVTARPDNHGGFEARGEDKAVNVHYGTYVTSVLNRLPQPQREVARLEIHQILSKHLASL